VDANDIQLEARALGDPTRYQLFRYIVDADRLEWRNSPSTWG
jgi:hypothetical protein